MRGRFPQYGPFRESSSLPWQGFTGSVIRNTLYFIVCFFIILRGSFENVKIVLKGVRVFPSCDPGCCGEVTRLWQSDVQVCPHPVFRLWGKWMREETKGEK
jgi:hypothetical protein